MPRGVKKPTRSVREGSKLAPLPPEINLSNPDNEVDTRRIDMEKEIASLKQKIDEEQLTNEELRRSHADLENAVKGAHSVAKGVLINRLKHWAGVDYAKPAYHVKSRIKTQQGEVKDAEGKILAYTDNVEGEVYLNFVDGNCVTNNLRAAEAVFKRLGHAIQPIENI